MALIRGHVGKVIYESEKYFVFSMFLNHSNPPVSDKSITVSGNLYGLQQIRAGITIEFVGAWVKHAKFGRQFNPYGWRPWADHDLGVERFLSECVEGFSDERLVQKIVGVFGTLTFDTMTEEPDKIRALAPNLESSDRMAIDGALLRWNEARALSNLSVFLQDYDLSEEVIRNVFTQFGMEAIPLISENPYRLVAVDGFSFAKADRLALRTGMSKDDPKRLEGAVLWILRQESEQGHLAVRRSEFHNLLISLFDGETKFQDNITHDQLMSAVDRLAEAQAVVIDPEVGVYLTKYFKYERQSAEMLAKFLTPSQIDFDLAEFTTDYEKSNQISFSEAQREAVLKLGSHRVLVLTGVPGSGKTTLLRSFVKILRRAGKSFALMAPTGMAAKRLSVLTEEPASTIHRALGYDGYRWGFNHTNKFTIDAVIVDESSMLDMELFFRIVDALHPTTTLIFVGDDAQLPSVGPGNVLRELLSCSVVPHVRLTQIFRQSKQSEIVVASNKINKGQSPLLENVSKDSEFQFVSVNDEDRVGSLIVQMAVKLKGRDANFQVLSPKYEGTVGINRLNELLRDQLNPAIGQKQYQAGKINFREGDRVMIVKNDYKLNVNNGDMGKLVTITRDSLKVRIHGIGPKAPDTYVDIPKSRCVSMMRLAYAISVHKSQGQEYDTVVMPISRSQGRMLQRNLFYTGITRAKKKVWLIGESAAVYKSIGNDKVVQRNTAFAKAIESALVKGVVPQQDAVKRENGGDH